MAIVRAVAEAHGGSARIVPGNGASVSLWLPDA
jgi:signal transduction histidine kinase